MKQILDMHSVPVAFTDRGDGRAFLLVHGAGANGNYWKFLAAELQQAHGSPRLIAPDLFGHGETPPWAGTDVARSSGRAYEYEDDVALLERLADRIDGAFDLVGHSSGGAVCLEYALRHPDRVRKLVVAEPMLPGILETVDAAAHAEVASAYEAAHRAVSSGRDEDAARCLFEYILGDGRWHKLADSIRHWMTQNVACTLAAHSRASLALRPARNRYAAITCPVLVLHGERTRVPFRRICEVVAASLPDAVIESVDGAAHNAPLTHAPLVNALVRTFL